jgi:hypothetical protein
LIIYLKGSKTNYSQNIYVPKGNFKQKINVKLYKKNKKNKKNNKKISYYFSLYKLFGDNKIKTSHIFMKFKRLSINSKHKKNINKIKKVNKKINRKLINFYLPYLTYNFRTSKSYQSKIKNKLYRKLNNDHSYQLKLLSALRLILASRNISKVIKKIRQTLINNKS